MKRVHQQQWNSFPVFGSERPLLQPVSVGEESLHEEIDSDPCLTFRHRVSFERSHLVQHCCSADRSGFLFQRFHEVNQESGGFADAADYASSGATDEAAGYPVVVVVVVHQQPQLLLEQTAASPGPLILSSVLVQQVPVVPVGSFAAAADEVVLVREGIGKQSSVHTVVDAADPLSAGERSPVTAAAVVPVLVLVVVVALLS